MAEMHKAEGLNDGGKAENNWYRESDLSGWQAINMNYELF